jgi:hypothetical protein
MTKYDGLSSLSSDRPVNDGIFVVRNVTVKMPESPELHISTARPPIPPDDHLCFGVRPRRSFCLVKHSYRVYIHMRGCDSVVLDAVCYVSAVPKSKCESILSEDTELFPILNYDTTVGLEDWVPEYTKSPGQHELLDQTEIEDGVSQTSSELSEDSLPPDYYYQGPSEYKDKEYTIGTIQHEKEEGGTVDIEKLIEEAMNDRIV